MVKLDRAAFERQLDDQLGFLSASIEAFDQGTHSEYKRIATAIRVLVHDTKNSVSLLTHLGKKGCQFYDSCWPDEAGPNGGWHGLTGVAFDGPNAGRHVPFLDDNPRSRQLGFDQWWSSPVLRDQKNRSLTRRQLVLIAANKDGGAHVDSELADEYAELTTQNTLGWWSDVPGGQSIIGGERAAIRQIGHEVLRTLCPDYTKSQPAGTKYMFGQSIHVGTREEIASISSQRQLSKKVGVNQPCPCGSGRKFKFCCQ